MCLLKNTFGSGSWEEGGFFNKMFMIFSLLEFLQGLKFKTFWRIRKANKKVHILGGDINFSPKPLWGECIFQ